MIILHFCNSMTTTLRQPCMGLEERAAMIIQALPQRHVRLSCSRRSSSCSRPNPTMFATAESGNDLNLRRRRLILRLRHTPVVVAMMMRIPGSLYQTQTISAAAAALRMRTSRVRPSAPQEAPMMATMTILMKMITSLLHRHLLFQTMDLA